ncbi:MAG: Ni/Fe hydrogenase subunit alpha [Cyanobacteria bacterium]|nr:Ni/Fe hydrogenase subunit alpha [Cyanobacteriota bacterium]
MTEESKKRIEIPEICRVEGHASVYVDIEGAQVTNVQLDVFEGTRFFERLVVGHHHKEIPHITSRVCAICSTGHVLAAIRAIEKISGFHPSHITELFRELMHLGMIIESNSTHIYALALPDFLGFADVYRFATEFQDEFRSWTELRNLGSTIQSTIGGRPFHPVNLHVGGFSSYPGAHQLESLSERILKTSDLAVKTCETLMRFKPPVRRTSEPVFLALIPESSHYGYFGDRIRSSSGFEADVDQYHSFLKEETVSHSHAKRSSFDGQPIMVGSLARLHLFHDRLSPKAKSIFQSTDLAKGDTNTIWNNLGQAIEMVEAMERCKSILETLMGSRTDWDTAVARQNSIASSEIVKGCATGAVECPRGTLYHFYEVNELGFITEADMVTPSAQNTFRIERDIQEVVTQTIENSLETETEDKLRANLETLVRAYDPCNTCATHMVAVRYLH